MRLSEFIHIREYDCKFNAIKKYDIEIIVTV